MILQKQTRILFSRVTFGIKIKAGALYYAVFIALLISLLSGLLIAYTYVHNSYINRQILQEQVISNVKSGVNLVLKNPDLISYGSEEEKKLFGNDYDIVKLKKEHWGAYDLIYSFSQRQNYKYSKIALLGDDLDKKEDIALYLTDKKKYLSISGNTLLKGTCYLPKLGIKRAYIEGQGYQNRELVYGSVLQSETKLPDLNSDKIKYLESLLGKQYSKEDSLVELEYNSSELISNSFYNKPLILYSDKLISLSGLKIEGNIILMFEQEITIPENCYLKDVIILAPSVIIEEGFKGTIQVISTENITVGKSCQLKYPSFLAVLKNTADSEFVLSIAQGTIVAGGVLLYSNSSNSSDPLKMKISESAKIYGTVYCNGYIEHKGDLYGSLFCEGFTLKTAASLYENHLLNATVDYSKLPKSFVGINLLDKPVNEKIVKWLD